MPRCFSTSIQSDVAWRELLRALTVPAIRIAPPKSSSFSVSVVLPASGCEMIANVRRWATSKARSEEFNGRATRMRDASRGEALDPLREGLHVFGDEAARRFVGERSLVSDHRGG